MSFISRSKTNNSNQNSYLFLISTYIEKNNVIKLIAKPNTKKTEIIGFDENKETFKINVSEPAENNKANIEIIKFFKNKLKKDVKIISGMTTRKKVLKWYQKEI